MSPIAMCLCLAGLCVAASGLLSVVAVAPRAQHGFNILVSACLGPGFLFAALAGGLALLRRRSPRSVLFRSKALRTICLIVAVTVTTLLFFGVVV